MRNGIPKLLGFIVFLRNVDKFSPAPSSENEGVLPKLPFKLLMSSNAVRKRTLLSLAYHIGATHGIRHQLLIACWIAACLLDRDLAI